MRGMGYFWKGLADSAGTASAANLQREKDRMTRDMARDQGNITAFGAHLNRGADAANAKLAADTSMSNAKLSADTSIATNTRSMDTSEHTAHLMADASRYGADKTYNWQTLTGDRDNLHYGLTAFKTAAEGKRKLAADLAASGGPGSQQQIDELNRLASLDDQRANTIAIAMKMPIGQERTPEQEYMDMFNANKARLAAGKGVRK